MVMFAVSSVISLCICALIACMMYFLSTKLDADMDLMAVKQSFSVENLVPLLLLYLHLQLCL